MTQRVTAFLPHLSSSKSLCCQISAARHSIRHAHELLIAQNKSQQRTLRTRQKPKVRTPNTDIDSEPVESSPKAELRLDAFDSDFEVESPAKATKAQKFQTWQGLKRITTSEWDERNAQQYKGFNAAAQETVTAREVEGSVHRALVETFYLHQYGESLEETQKDNILLSPQQFSSATFSQRGESTFLLHKDAGETSSSTGQKSDAQTAPQAHATSIAIEPPRSIKWTKVSLSDSDLKFAVLKRTSQLLGLRIPDPEIDSIRNAGDLVGLLSRKPKTIKLEKEVSGSKILSKHNNLQWGVRTQNDKDREHGSLKVIEEELRKVRLMTPEQRQWVLGK